MIYFKFKLKNCHLHKRERVVERNTSLNNQQQMARKQISLEKRPLFFKKKKNKKDQIKTPTIYIQNKYMFYIYIHNVIYP